MKELIGTWKSIGTITKAGQFTTQKVPVTFTFNEDGSGNMRYLIVMSATFTWESDGRNSPFTTLSTAPIRNLS